MISIAICDDDAMSRRQIEDAIFAEDYGEVFQINCFSNADGLLAGFRAGAGADIIFLDMGMSTLGEMDIAGQIRALDKDVIFIFISPYANDTPDAFREQSPNCLLTPASPESLKRILTLTVRQYHETHSIYTLQSRSAQIAIPVREICYLEVNDHILSVHMEKNALVCKGRLKDESEKLIPYGFIQCHRSYLVNLSYIAKLDKLNIVMQNGDRIPISKQNKRNVMEQFTKFKIFSM